jgi:hypothetical protein
MLTIVCFKWKPKDYWDGVSRCEFTAEHVNILHSMIKRHYHNPFRFVCITDDPEGIEAETFPIWDDLADVVNPLRGWVSCYRRLKIFSKEMLPIFGPRILLLDLDCVIVDDVTAIWDRPEPFVGIRLHPQRYSPYKGLKTTAHRRRQDVSYLKTNESYGGAMYLLDTGAFPEVWEDFDILNSPQEAIHHGYRGSDQAWLSYKLGTEHPVWTVKDDGVRSARYDGLLIKHRLPAGTRMVIFHGRHRPWGKRAGGCRWVRENYK